MIKVKTKVCFKCKVEKDACSFHADKRNTTTGLYAWCKNCKSKKTAQWNRDNFSRKRNTELKRNYGITLEDYHKMKEAQNNCCAICGTSGDKLRRTLLVDHNHTTGKVRDLLCDGCNHTIGHAKEDIEILKNAIKYIKKHNNSKE